MRSIVALLLAALLFEAVSSKYISFIRQTWSVKVWKKANGECVVLSKGMGQVHRLATDNNIIVSKRPQAEFEDKEEEESGFIVQVYGNPDLSMDYLQIKENCKFVQEEYEPEVNTQVADDIRKIVDNGPPSNRIDVVFMGDGYTLSQRELHFSDMARLTRDMFNGETFVSYLPVFNIWGVHRESKESGIGINSTPKNTAFGLYRVGSELRGVYTSKPAAAREACRQTGTDACDFPSLIGNDPYYGGLGGEFTISTSSITSGTIVLRHEFGHNFGDVGEEYDGGSAYFGANNDNSLSNINWKHWLTNPSRLVAEKNAQRAQDYAWYDLAKGSYTIRFNSDGKYARWFMRFSVSGCPEPGSLKVAIDGVELPWNSTSLLDRSFYEYSRDYGFSSGAHTLVFTSSFPPSQNQIRQLCSVSLHEYMNETDYHTDNSYIGMYPTFRQGGFQAGYRPNNEYCLMRNMSSVHFCSVCQENNWIQFFQRITLLDGVDIQTSGNIVTVTLDAIPLAQLREGGKLPYENYVVTWKKGGVVRSDLNNKFSFSEDLSTARGSWEVTIKYESTEIRYDPNKLTTTTEKFTI